MLDLWIVMAGPAGSGKSTLSESLGVSLRRDGATVDVFGENELFRRREFASAAEIFSTANGPAPTAMEFAYAAWANSFPAGAVAVMDWNPASMAGDLAWARADRSLFRVHLETVGKLPRRPIAVLDLQVTPEVAVERAARQRGEAWLASYDLVARTAGRQETNRLNRIIAWTEEHMACTAAELDVAASAGWSIHRVDASPSTELVQKAVQQLIGQQSESDHERPQRELPS